MASFIRWKCPCGKTLRIPVHLQGKRLTCPACGDLHPVSTDLSAGAEIPAGAPVWWWQASWIALFGFLGVLLLGGLIYFVVTSQDQPPSQVDPPAPATIAAVAPKKPRPGDT